MFRLIKIVALIYDPTGSGFDSEAALRGKPRRGGKRCSMRWKICSSTYIEARNSSRFSTCKPLKFSLIFLFLQRTALLFSGYILAAFRTQRKYTAPSYPFCLNSPCIRPAAAPLMMHVVVGGGLQNSTRLLICLVVPLLAC